MKHLKKFIVYGIYVPSLDMTRDIILADTQESAVREAEDSRINCAEWSVIEACLVNDEVAYLLAAQKKSKRRVASDWERYRNEFLTPRPVPPPPIEFSILPSDEPKSSMESLVAEVMGTNTPKLLPAVERHSSGLPTQGRLATRLASAGGSFEAGTLVALSHATRQDAAGLYPYIDWAEDFNPEGDVTVSVDGLPVSILRPHEVDRFIEFNTAPVPEEVAA